MRVMSMVNVAEYCILANAEMAKWLHTNHRSEAELHFWDHALEEELLRAAPAAVYLRAACFLRLWDPELTSEGSVSSVSIASFYARMPACVAVIDSTLSMIYRVGLLP